MSNFIKRIYPIVIEILLWVVVIVGTIGGFVAGINNNIGAALLGAVLGFLGSLVFNIIVFGTLLLFINISEKIDVINEQIKEVKDLDFKKKQLKEEYDQAEKN